MLATFTDPSSISCSKFTNNKWIYFRIHLSSKFHSNSLYNYAKESLIKLFAMATDQTNETPTNVKPINPKVKVEYCGVCDYGGHCLALGQTIRKATPNAIVNCLRGRQGAFEVEVNDKLIYSKLQTMALPDFNEVAEVVNNVSLGEEPRLIKGQQPINCAIS